MSASVCEVSVQPSSVAKKLRRETAREQKGKENKGTCIKKEDEQKKQKRESEKEKE
jgi:hypothetical protein